MDPVDAETGPAYWSTVIRRLRVALQASQSELAARVGTNQATISRWERGSSVPQVEVRRVLEELCRVNGIVLFNDFLSMVKASPFPMILVDRHGNVAAASASSGFVVGEDAMDRTPAEERDFLARFQGALEDAGFWDKLSPRLDYEVRVGGEVRRAVVTAVAVRGEVYALVQKA